MNVSLSEYAICLSESDVQILEKLISKKYRKFIKFFHLMKDYTSSIEKMKYEFSEDETLSVSMTFTKKISLDNKKELLEEMSASGYMVDAKISGKKLKLVITYEE